MKLFIFVIFNFFIFKIISSLDRQVYVINFLYSEPMTILKFTGTIQILITIVKNLKQFIFLNSNEQTFLDRLELRSEII